MPTPSNYTVGRRLFESYANLAMAEMAVHDGDAQYSKRHYMIRARLLAGLTKGTMAPRSLMLDQRIRMRLPQECIYCGAVDNLSIDHVIATDRGGMDSGDNAVWACRTCNSSKGNRDLFEWWIQMRRGFPPLFVIRIYLKQAICYCHTNGLMDRAISEVGKVPFAFEAIPVKFPAPGALIFSPSHARSQLDQQQQSRWEVLKVKEQHMAEVIREVRALTGKEDAAGSSGEDR